MSLILFLLGRPGCGKSTAAIAHIRELAKCQHLNITRLKDYEKLYRRFQAEEAGQANGPKRFRAIAHEGFDVLDFTVMDEVLVELQQEIEATLAAQDDRLIIVEFARDEYYKPLCLFPQDILQNAYFLFVEASLESCIKRIHERIKNPIRVDNHFVSDDILRGYYSKDNVPYIRDHLAQDLGIESQRVKIVDNNGTREQFLEKVEQFFQGLFSASVPPPAHYSVSRVLTPL